MTHEDPKNQVFTIPRSVFAIVTLVGAVMVSYYTAQMSFADRVAMVDKETAVNTANITSVTTRLDSIDKKLDVLIQRGTIQALKQ